VQIHLLAALLAIRVSAAWRRGAVFHLLLGSGSHNTTVASSTNAVVHLIVELRESVLVVDGSLLKVRDSGCVNNVTDNVALDGLVLRNQLAGKLAGDTALAASVLFLRVRDYVSS